MALDTNRSGSQTSSLATLWGSVRDRTAAVQRGLGQWARPVSAPITRALAPLEPAWRTIHRYLPEHYIKRSLLRRIIVSNAIGLGILLFGLGLITHNKAYLIDARRDALMTQGRILSLAITSATLHDHHGSLARIDPDRLPAVDGAMIPFRDDNFSSLVFPLPPEKVAPVLRRLIDSNETRARVYTKDPKTEDLRLVADSAEFLQRGQILRDERDEPQVAIEKPKDFWTRVTQWLMWTTLTVYREVESKDAVVYREVAIAVTGVPTPFLSISPRGEQILSVAYPIRRARNVVGVLLLSTLPGDLESELVKETSVPLTLGALAIFATLLAATLLARTVAGPIKQLSDAAEHVSRDITAIKNMPDYSHRSDEVGQMSRSFRAMTDALYRRIEASEKFAADVAHELKNPLTAARSLADSLSYAKTTEQRDQLVGQIQHELKRLNRLITDVSNASRLDAELARQQMEDVDLRMVATSVVQSFRDILSGDSRQIQLDLEDARGGAYIVRGHDGRLGQVLTNLIDNAVSFLPNHATVTVRLSRTDDWIVAAIEDEGPGIPDDKLEQIFERFYTDRPDTEAQRGKNSGLGLSICREIVAAHGGVIFVENLRHPDGDRHGPPSGARFVVQLPSMTALGHTARPLASLKARRG